MNRTVRELIRTYLAQEGYRVSTLGDGQGLRRELAGQSVDLVILDLGLPGEGRNIGTSTCGCSKY